MRKEKGERNKHRGGKRERERERERKRKKDVKSVQDSNIEEYRKREESETGETEN